MTNKYAVASREAQARRRKNRTCTWKRVYETKEAAYQKGQVVYHCPFCGKYHRSGKFGRLVARVNRKKVNKKYG